MSPVWFLVVVGVIYFIYSLGFMTGFYDYFYAGTNETYTFYKELQVVNHFIFSTSLVIIVTTGFCLLTGIDHKSRNWLWIGALSAVAIYLITRVVTLIQTMPYFTDWHKTLDIGTLDTRQDPTVMLQLTYIIPAVAVVLIAVIAWNNFRKPAKEEAIV
ncbi:hypothetical protein LZ578_00460 [Jeotgalibaca sp. MA1X17-3]|uniref:hypothetical protein n=1 Tax=Jeotgalibaca sp. MA1X17-3 TaxID=2908211 RepID=UPI001F345277|nr:hypothetical protein [Jeotgalibaca sp. MA1X17-3]UJF15718.1 hypothetical protein LZ578_00460 [Jeotgalibaca sp. MA1X17-3]